VNVQADNLRQLMNDALAVLFDFDGPLCDVFAGLPAPRVARDLERVAGRTFATDDPLEVLRQSAGTASANAVETALTEAEFSAVNQSVANVEGVEVLRKSRARGQAIAVVSNNSRAAVTAFLETHGLTPDVSTVIGRTPGRPDLMKPNPWPVRLALEALGCPSDRAVFVGDTLSDIEAAHSAGVSCVALANKPGKRATFEGLEALVIDSMADLMTRL
jgi:HAD superfamily hydrolase (TIGR01509 family)